MDELIARIGIEQHGVISRAQARTAGLTRGAIKHRVDAGRWLEITPRVYRLAGAPNSEYRPPRSPEPCSIWARQLERAGWRVVSMPHSPRAGSPCGNSRRSSTTSLSAGAPVLLASGQ